MGLCSSNKIHPVDKNNMKKLQKNLKIESKYLIKYFTHDFFQNIHKCSNIYKNIHKWKVNILIFETIIQIIMIENDKKRNIYIKRLKSVFTNNGIEECTYVSIQLCLVELLKQGLGDTYTPEIIESWIICCEDICQIIKLI